MGRFILSLLLLSNAAGSASSEEDCSNLEGMWYNTLGSDMNITHAPDETFIGKYRTAVEREEGAAGNSSHSPLFGTRADQKPGGVVGFTVLWRDGASVTVWTGQCHVCNGKEVLKMSWLLRSRQSSCIDVWKSTMIGQDDFYREEQVPISQSAGEGMKGESDRTREVVEHNVSPLDTQYSCSFNGFWYNDAGSEMLLNHHSNRSIRGEYRAGIHRVSGMTSHSHVYGLGNPNDPNTTASIIVVWQGGKAVTGWVGQCHLCGEDRTPLLETVWLQRVAIPGCHNNWRSAYYGSNTFTRTPQKQGPSKNNGTHTPQEDGEFLGQEICTDGSASGAKETYASVALVLGTLLYILM